MKKRLGQYVNGGGSDPCPACGGSGDQIVVTTLPSGRKWAHPVDCPKCGGSGEA